MKTLSTIAWVVLALVATACVDTTPEHVVGSASTALQKNDLKAFTETLSGTALDQYGSQEGMTILQAKLSGQKIKTTSPQSVAVTPTPSGRIDTYAVSVLNRDNHEKLLDLTINCFVDASEPPTVCANPSPVACGVSSNAHCMISAIQIADQP